MLGLIYLVVAFLTFWLILWAIKAHDGRVVVGDVLMAVIGAVIPMLNVYLLVFAIATLIECGAGRAFFGKKIF